MAVTVTIGRNVGESMDARPMSTGTWEAFREEVEEAVARNVGHPYFTGTGIGRSEQWGQEDAFTVIAAEPFYSDVREALLKDLAEVGRLYGQEAVAVTIGETIFV